MAQRLISRELAYPGESSFIVLFRGRDGLTWRDPRYRESLTAALAGLRADPRVRAVLSPDDAPQVVAERMVSDDRRKALAVVTLRDDYFKAMAAYPSLRATVTSDLLETGFTGYLAYRNDLDRTLEHDVLFAELVSLPLALLRAGRGVPHRGCSGAVGGRRRARRRHRRRRDHRACRG